MTLESQLRRGMFSIVGLIGLVVVIGAQGHAAVDATVMADTALAQCDAPATLPAEPLTTSGRGGSPEGRADWRALLPAMIFTTNR